MTRGIIYYTDNRLEEPIASAVQRQLLAARLPIVSVSLAPMAFGTNIVLPRTPSYQTMIVQITTALEHSRADTVFFCEHDVLYSPSHFDFTPPRNDIFYYNTHIWRWDFPHNRAITYDRLICLSGLSVNRLFALAHYRKRLEKIKSVDWSADPQAQPRLARKWGYEPGTKKRKRGGFSNDDFETWQSADPIVDIRHDKTFSLRKVTLGAFSKRPTNWKEIALDKIPGWDVQSVVAYDGL